MNQNHENDLCIRENKIALVILPKIIISDRQGKGCLAEQQKSTICHKVLVQNLLENPLISDIYAELDIPLDKERKLNVLKTFRKGSGRLLNVLCTLNLHPRSIFILHALAKITGLKYAENLYIFLFWLYVPFIFIFHRPLSS